MQKTFIGFLLILIMVVLLALHNEQMAYIDFWMWRFQTSLSVLILITFFIGATISFLLSIPGRKRMKRTIGERDTSLDELKVEISKLKQKITEIETKQKQNLNLEKHTYGD